MERELRFTVDVRVSVNVNLSISNIENISIFYKSNNVWFYFFNYENKRLYILKRFVCLVCHVPNISLCWFYKLHY